MSLSQGPAQHLVRSGIIESSSSEDDKKNKSKLGLNQVLQLQSQNGGLLMAHPCLFTPHEVNRPIINLSLTTEVL